MIKKNLKFIIILLIIPIVSAISSTNYVQNITSINSAALNTSSNNYENKISLSSISGNSSSTNYETCTGFQCSTLNNKPNSTTIPDQTLTQNSQITINLSNYFQDIDQDSLTYSSSSTSNLSVSFSNEIATIIGVISGTTSITFTADDSQETTTSNSVTFIISPIPPKAETGGVAGGGGGAIGSGPGGSLYKDFKFNIATDLIELKQSESTSIELIIENTGNNPLAITIENTLQEFISLSSSQLIIPAKEKSAITLYIQTQENTPPNAYIGKLIIKANGIQKLITLTILVSSKQSVIDVKLDIPPDQITLKPGQDLRSQLTIINKGEIPELSTITTFTIKDLENNIILERIKELLIKDQLSLTEIFKLPEFLQGNFILTASVQYQDKTSLAAQKFSVLKEEKPQEYFPIKPIYTIIAITIIALIIASLIYLNHLRLKKLKKIKPKRLIKTTSTKNKLNLLKEAYQKGFISRLAYKFSLKKLKKRKDE